MIFNQQAAGAGGTGQTYATVRITSNGTYSYSGPVTVDVAVGIEEELEQFIHSDTLIFFGEYGMDHELRLYLPSGTTVLMPALCELDVEPDFDCDGCAVEIFEPTNEIPGVVMEEVDYCVVLLSITAD